MTYKKTCYNSDGGVRQVKITMLTIGSTGDVRPFILLGKELLSRGHTVTIAAFSAFRPMVEREGLGFFPLSGDAEKFINSLMQPGSGGITFMSRLKKGLNTVAPQLIQDMYESCLHAEAMICNFFGSVYYSIAEKLGIPCIQIQYCIMDPNSEHPLSVIKYQNLASWINRSSFKLGYLVIGVVESRYLSAWRKENHVLLRKPHTAPDYRIGSHQIPVIYALSPAVVHRPAEWGSHIHMSGFWFDPCPPAWSAPEDLQRFLNESDPPVYIGFGSMNSGDMNRLTAIVLRSVHAAGIRAVVSAGSGSLIYSSNSKVFFTHDYVPHDWLFPRVRAVVHHGGAGTTAAGLLYGRPTLVIPFSGDQPFWGHRVYELGCGPKPLSREKLTVHRFTKALLDLCSQEHYRIKAEEISSRLRVENGTKNAADLIEKEIHGWNESC